MGDREHLKMVWSHLVGKNKEFVKRVFLSESEDSNRKDQLLKEGKIG